MFTKIKWTLKKSLNKLKTSYFIIFKTKTSNSYLKLILSQININLIDFIIN